MLRIGIGFKIVLLGLISLTISAATQDNLWEMVLSSTTLSKSQFEQLYQESYRQLDQAGYSRLLEQYLADLRAENFTQAQIDLVRLSAGTFFNISADYLLQTLQVESNPWGAGSLWTASNSEPWDFQIKNFLINQFMNLYSRLNLWRKV